MWKFFSLHWCWGVLKKLLYSDSKWCLVFFLGWEWALHFWFWELCSVCEIHKWDTIYATVEHSASSTYECWKLSTNTCMCLFVFGVYMLHKSCLVSLIRFKSKYCFCCVLPNAVEMIGRMIRLVWHPSMNPFCYFLCDPEQLWVLDSVPGEVNPENRNREVEKVLHTLQSLPSPVPSRK